MPNSINLSVAVKGSPATMENTTIEGTEGAPGPVEDPKEDKEEEASMSANALRPVMLEARLLHCPRSFNDQSLEGI